MILRPRKFYAAASVIRCSVFLLSAAGCLAFCGHIRGTFTLLLEISYILDYI